MADTKQYNGHANWATWNVNLWIDNDQGLYLAKMEWLRGKHEPVQGDEVEAFVRDLMPSGTPDFKTEGGVKNYDDVDWDEIAEGWHEDQALPDDDEDDDDQ